MIKHGLGLPYMGSKRKIAKDIVDKILEIKPNTKYVFDLFGGGGAITFEFLQRPQIWAVIYNDKNKAIADLIKKLVYDGLPEVIYTRWVSRKEFNENKNRNDWYGGYLQTVWSFGNNGKNYLYGKDKEWLKFLLHNIVVYKDMFSINYLRTYLSGKFFLPESFFSADLFGRRLILLKTIKRNHSDKEVIKYLEHLTRAEHLVEIKTAVESNSDFMSSRLIVVSKSYDEIPIDTPPEETVIYLDPPYRNTAKYKHDIDFNELDEWIKNNKYDVFLSEYNAPFDVVWQKSKRVLLGNDNSLRKIEKLFYHKGWG